MSLGRWVVELWLRWHHPLKMALSTLPGHRIIVLRLRGVRRLVTQNVQLDRPQRQAIAGRERRVVKWQAVDQSVRRPASNGQTVAATDDQAVDGGDAGLFDPHRAAGAGTDGRFPGREADHALPARLAA
jgi:hypothetical protein